MTKSDRRLVTPATDQLFPGLSPTPTILLTVIHEQFGRGWHLWSENGHLVVTEMDVRWRQRMVLSTDGRCWIVRFHPSLPEERRLAWADWLKQFPTIRYHLPSGWQAGVNIR